MTFFVQISRTNENLCRIRRKTAGKLHENWAHIITFRVPKYTQMWFFSWGVFFSIFFSILVAVIHLQSK